MTESQNPNVPNPDPVREKVRKVHDFSRFVAIDIETTGLNPADSEIIELGAVRFQDNEEQEVFRLLVKPEHGLPERNRRLTGIEPEMLADATDAKSALEKFKDFIGDDLLISHNAPFDTNFLKHHLEINNLDPINNPAVCTLHLSAIVNPEAGSLQLGNLAKSWNIDVVDPHRALQDARMAGRLFVKIMNEIGTWPSEFIAHLAGYRGKSTDPIFDLLDILKGDQPADTPDFDLGHEVIWRLRNPDKESCLPLLKFPDNPGKPEINEDREMGKEIIDAFDRGGVTMIEDLRPGTDPASFSIPVDPGKPLKLVVAIPDQNELERVLGKDNGFDGISGTDGAFFLGSRSDYVCTYRAFEPDGRPIGWLELSPFERVVLARWLAGTHTGRIARVNWWLLNNFSGLKEHLNTLSISSNECTGPGPENIGNCFIELARMKAAGAGRIIVTQKHLCLRKSGGKIGERLLESVDACVIENASYLIDAAREADSCVLELDVLSRRLSTILNLNQDDETGFRDCTEAALEQISNITATCKRTISEYRNKQPRGSSYPIHINRDNWEDDDFTELAGALDIAVPGLEKTIAEIENNPGISMRNRTIARALRDALETIKIFRESPWDWAASIEGVPVRKPKRVSMSVVPVEVGPVVKRIIDESKSGVVAVDRHLRSGDSFDRIKRQWAIPASVHVEERVLQDEKPVLPGLYLPDDVTSPTARSGRRYHWEKYMERTANLLRMFAEILGGRTIAVFNAHHELRRVRELIGENPPSDCIVLAQYMDGTKSSLVREYKSNPKTLLLGGRNFLDNVDLRPAGFTVLVMVKLPFVSPEEPIHRASLQMIESQGIDSMMSYLVPLAIETANRWIDSLTAGPVPEGIDPGSPPGVVILLDPRAVLNDWGESFVNSLNASPVYSMPFIEIRKRIAELRW